MYRVTIYAHRLRSSTGSGMQRYTDGLLGALEQVGAPDLDLTAVSPGPIPDDLHGRSVTYRSVPLPRKLIHGAWLFADVPPVEWLVGRSDLVHLLSTAIPVPSRAPHVITIHDLFTVRHPEWFEPRSVRTTLKTLRRAVRSARRIIVQTAFVGRDVSTTLDVDPQRITLVPTGLDSSFVSDQPADEQARIVAGYGLSPGSYLIMVGLLSPRKNLKVLAEAWAVMRSRDGGTVPPLVVVGPVDVGHESVRREVDRLGVADCIRFAGYVPGADLRALVANATALVHPAVDEGFGLTPIEAMAAGVPALVSNAGAIPEVTGDAAWHLDPHDPDAWADAVQIIQQDSQRRAAMVEAGRRRAAMFTWSAAAKGTLDVYRAALSGG